MKDKRAFIFYFLMTIIFYDFASQLKKLSYYKEALEINNPVFSIVHTQNTGGAFSVFQNNPYPLALFGIFAVVFLTIYVYKKISFQDKAALLSITLFCAGTLGNLLERLKYHYVIDYFKLNFINFPIFNTFDIMICLGAIIYFIFVLFEFPIKKQESKNENSN